MEKRALIREMGNCGSLEKLTRIVEAIRTAQTHKTKIVLVLDPLVYGDSATVIDQIDSYDFNKTDIIINGNSYPWWDITKLNLIF